MSSPHLRVGVDIGGTFTDIVVMDTRTNTTRAHKVLSTPREPAKGMLHGLDELEIAKAIEFLVHGTTAGLNAILSRTGERAALVTTKGFDDVLLLGRAGNKDIWSLSPKRTAPLVDRDDIHTVNERMRYDGSVEMPLDPQEVAALLETLERDGVRSVAVCFLHSHHNPAHELAFKALLQQRLPGISIVLSHQIAPEQGEFERTSTTVATAYVSRTVETYLAALVEELDVRGCAAPLHVMRSSGGICSAELVARQPIQTILSGPAGGVVAAETVARTLGRPNLIAIDMGGTSSDVSLVIDGRMTLSAESEIADTVMKMPVVELHTIGAGGGSIARAEAGGLRVGPLSAGANPGPACYGLGGTKPTVTDAQLLLGRIDPEWFLGGRMGLDVHAAKEAMASLAGELNIDVEAAAAGVLAVANGMMANAIRTLTMRRGIDHRGFSLLAFGGAGPLHGVALAEELGITEVIVPFSTGVLSAWGMLHADIRHDVSAPLGGLANAVEARALVVRTLGQLREEGAKLLLREGVDAAGSSYVASVEMCYAGQTHTVSVRMADPETLLQDFHDTYHQHFGHSMPGAPVELVQMRLAATGRIGAQFLDRDMSSENRPEATRTVTIDGVHCEARIVHRESLGRADVVDGPAIILEAGSTTLVPPGWSARQEKFGTLIIRKAGA
ncbi:hydantoinase/oxoprolinase family protein (plasmid) [Ensifer adhaerens]|uniref:hydantoinase/oxoprolinase family protein n=1 Tax=Ensifer adhaerens TaxID=106592 RepID=UPI001CC1BD1B|nr:hydantoinase/oxoprolinase family protein [Ensifer adhaerens]MBZ7927166.1 hydantoinase/oxoprolinase family protein [Ensifer adhaerens]UAX98202.1 hydantoinase/oxoprolinase family protein [Ensifer adhaerens]UAY05584.1 hydantoinase/oxoprolinase family protein [Ensifer adhaerens]UAY12962.1 hydantoinase/oxoprolinase family protein [Ensifer adhaerens]